MSNERILPGAQLDQSSAVYPRERPTATKFLGTARRCDGRVQDVDPSLFYTGIVAELFEPLRSVAPDAEPYARFIEVSGQPALELGCGTGDPLLALRRRGIDVEGVDSSADMLDRCQRRAAEEGLDVVVHHQRMESLDLPRRYRTIFLAGPTFNLLPDDALASRALLRIRAHLDDGGSALVPLFVPQPTPEQKLGQVREAQEPDGSTIRVSAIAEKRNDGDRCQETILRYERVIGDTSTIVDRPWILHWYSQNQFRELAACAGLATVMVLDAAGGPADEKNEEFAFWLNAAS
jgi:SAM-dependent methyltransferase